MNVYRPYDGKMNLVGTCDTYIPEEFCGRVSIYVATGSLTLFRTERIATRHHDGFVERISEHEVYRWPATVERAVVLQDGQDPELLSGWVAIEGAE